MIHEVLHKLFLVKVPKIQLLINNLKKPEYFIQYQKVKTYQL